ncbi:MAG: hypothetical protein J6Y48_20325 [Clostridia bacterium]|nr:hypothetical protein [Clostridia bacterium]
MLSVHCPKCNATTKFDETKEIPTYCMFCGAHLPDMSNYVREALKLGLDKQHLDIDRQRHEMTMEEMNTDIRRTKVRNELPITKVIVFIITILFIVFSLLIMRVR